MFNVGRWKFSAYGARRHLRSTILLQNGMIPPLNTVILSRVKLKPQKLKACG
jgi:hypothetical protein